jgi:hypothetical protein
MPEVQCIAFRFLVKYPVEGLKILLPKDGSFPSNNPIRQVEASGTVSAFLHKKTQPFQSAFRPIRPQKHKKDLP